MNNEKTFKLEKLNFRIDYSESLPQLEIENDTSMFHLRVPFDDVEKLCSFIENFIDIYKKTKKNQDSV